MACEPHSGSCVDLFASQGDYKGKDDRLDGDGSKDLQDPSLRKPEVLRSKAIEYAGQLRDKVNEVRLG